MKRRDMTIAVHRLGEEPDPGDDEARLTPAERVARIWEVTQQAWAFRGEPSAPSRLSRRVVRVLKREG